MSGQDATKVRVALAGRIWLLPEGTEVPEDVTTDPVGGIDLGFTSDDGVTFSIGRETESIPGWPSADPLRVLITSEPKTCSFNLRQVERDTITAALGGSVSELASGTYRWEPNEGIIATHMLIVDFEDGVLADGVTPLRYRFGFKRAQNTAAVEFTLVRNAAVDLPNEWNSLAVGTGKSWWIDSNDPAMAPAGTTPPDPEG